MSIWLPFLAFGQNGIRTVVQQRTMSLAFGRQTMAPEEDLRHEGCADDQPCHPGSDALPASSFCILLPWRKI